jgi:hypothetical protein
MKFYPQIFNLFSGEKSKILFDKIKRQLYKNFYLNHTTVEVSVMKDTDSAALVSTLATQEDT